MRDYIASFLIVAGSAMVILFSDHRDIDYSVCDLVQLYRRPSVIAILCVLVALGTGLFIFILFGEKRISTLKAASLSAATSPTVDQSFLGSPKSDTFPKIANLEAPSSTADLDPRKHGSAWIRYGLPFAYATLGAVFGAITVVLAKSSSELLATLFKKEEDAAAGKNVTVVDLTGEGAPRSTCDMGGVSVYAFGWSIAAALAFCAVVQIICINASLKRYDALTQVPLYYVIWTLLGNFMGAVYFDEFQNFTPLRIVFFCFGISLNVAGVFIISSRFSDEGGEDGGGKDVTSEEDDMNPSKDEKSPIIA
ncbi:NIPA-like protein 3 [Quaeritorhiza haematococci]|nr:NIPA-like protein 3 [Quaeritorhiza haematococci]